MWEELSKELDIKTGEVVTNAVCRYRDGVVFGINDTGIVVYFDLKNNEYKTLLEIENVKIKYTYMHGGLVYISQIGGGDIIVIDPDDNTEVKRISCGGDMGEPITLLFDKDYIWLVPRFGSIIGLIDTQTNAVKKIDINCEGLLNFFPETNRFFAKGRVMGNSVYLLPYNTNGIVEINKASLEFGIHTIVADNDLDRLERNIFKNYDDVYYEKDMALSNYLYLLKERI